MAAVESPVALTGKRRRREAPALANHAAKKTKIDASYFDGSDNDQDYSLSHEESESEASESELDNESRSAVSTPATPASSLAGPTSISSTRPLIHSCTYPGCDKVYSRPSRLEEHMRSHTNERPFKCAYENCTKAFRRQGHLDHHIKSAHTRERKYACDWEGCDKRFITAQRLKNHRETHVKKDRYRCTGFPPCDKTFRKHGTLQKHIDIDHLHKKPYPCKDVDETTGKPCAAAFDRAYSLRCHVATQHAGAKHWCSICTTEPAAANGIKLELGTEANPSAPLGFATHAELQAHVKQAHPPTCPACAKTFTYPSELEQHIKTHHSTATLQDRRTHVCPHPGCGKGFVKRSNLTTHLRSSHEKRKPFVCGTTPLASTADLAAWTGSNACGRGFTAKASLESHVRKFHLGRESDNDNENANNANNSKHATTDLSTYRRQPSTVARLTGAGYAAETGRHIACPVSACAHRFKRAADLRQHVRATHALQQAGGGDRPGDGDEGGAAEARQELEALCGGRFWIGGLDEREDGEYRRSALGFVSDEESDSEDDAGLAAELGLKGPAVRVRGGAFEPVNVDVDVDVDGEEGRLMRDLEFVVRGAADVDCDEEKTEAISEEMVDPELR